MTIFDACGKLFEWFQTHNTFELDANFKDFFMISEDADKDKAILTAALNDLCKMEVIVQQEIHGKTFFILRKPLESMDKDVKIPHTLAMQMGETINRFCDKIEDQRDACEWSSITEKDLVNLVNIIHYYYTLEDGANESLEEEEGATEKS